MSQRLSCAVDSSLRPDSWAHLKFGKLLRIAALPCIFLVIYKPSALFVANQHRRPPPCTPLSPTFHALRAPQRPRACDRRLAYLRYITLYSIMSRKIDRGGMSQARVRRDGMPAVGLPACRIANRCMLCRSGRGAAGTEDTTPGFTSRVS